MNYQTEMTVLQICCKASLNIPKCPLEIVKKGFLPYQTKNMTFSEAKQVATWIDSAYEGLNFQENANFLAMIESKTKATLPVPLDVDSVQETNQEKKENYDRVMHILSNDQKMVFCSIKAKSIGMITNTKFIWSDYLTTDEIGSGLADLKAKLSPAETHLAASFLQKQVNLVEATDYDMIIGLYRLKLGKKYLARITVGDGIAECLAFDEDQIHWELKSFASVVNKGNSENNQIVNELNDFAEKNLNYINTGEHFDSGAPGIVKISSESLIDTSTCVVCSKTDNLKKCGRCKKIQYCGTQCQKADWDHHKLNYSS